MLSPPRPSALRVVVALPEQLRVSALSGKGEATILTAEEILLLIVDEIRKAHFAQYYLELVEPLGLLARPRIQEALGDLKLFVGRP
jgi:hypothetical protein